MARRVLSVAVNVLIVLMVLAAWLIRSDGVFLSSTGLRNLRYFTVLSNLLCGLSSLVYVIALLCGKRKGNFGVSRPVWLLKYAGTVSVTLTLLTVLLFLGPVFGYSSMFQGANFWFHLIIPIVAILCFCFFDEGNALSFPESFVAAIPMLIYGAVYLCNILFNGVGEWPDSNDWYGFTTWGLPIGCVIFAVLIAITWGAALVLRFVRIRLDRKPIHSGL